MNVSEIDRAYFAGFFDGDGSVSIISPPSQNFKAGKRWGLQVRVWQVSEHAAVLHTLKEEYGGHTAERAFASGRPATEWKVSDRLAEKFLKDIFPYSIVKHDRIAVALKFRETYNHAFRGRNAYNKMQEIYRERQKLKDQINYMNKRHSPKKEK